MDTQTDLSGRTILSEATRIHEKAADLAKKAEYALLRTATANCNQQPKNP